MKRQIIRHCKKKKLPIFLYRCTYMYILLIQWLVTRSRRFFLLPRGYLAMSRHFLLSQPEKGAVGI